MIYEYFITAPKVGMKMDKRLFKDILEIIEMNRGIQYWFPEQQKRIWDEILSELMNQFDIALNKTNLRCQG